MRLNDFTKLSINLMQNKKEPKEENKCYWLDHCSDEDCTGCKQCCAEQRIKPVQNGGYTLWVKGTPYHNQELADHARKITGRGLEKWQMM